MTVCMSTCDVSRSNYEKKCIACIPWLDVCTRDARLMKQYANREFALCTYVFNSALEYSNCQSTFDLSQKSVSIDLDIIIGILCGKRMTFCLDANNWWIISKKFLLVYDIRYTTYIMYDYIIYDITMIWALNISYIDAKDMCTTFYVCIIYF